MPTRYNEIQESGNTKLQANKVRQAEENKAGLITEPSP